MPDDLRNLLSEFNGVYLSYGPGDLGILYLDINHIVEDELVALPDGQMSIPVPHYLKNSGGNPLPASLSNVVFVANSNGYGALFALCLEDFATFHKGEVLMLANDIGEFETDHPSLMDFVRSGCKLL